MPSWLGRREAYTFWTEIQLIEAWSLPENQIEYDRLPELFIARSIAIADKVNKQNRRRKHLLR